ncbi:MAG: hypothetical protein WBP53_13955 [Dokdonella sp.]
MIQSGLVLLFVASTAAATTFTVDTTQDSPTGTGTSGSLRYLLGQAGNGDTIGFSCAALNCPVTIPVHNLDNDGATDFLGMTAIAHQANAPGRA